MSLEGDPTTQQPDPSIVQEDEHPTQQQPEPSIFEEDEKLLPPSAVDEQPSALTEEEDDDDQSADLLAIHPVECKILFIISVVLLI